MDDDGEIEVNSEAVLRSQSAQVSVATEAHGVTATMQTFDVPSQHGPAYKVPFPFSPYPQQLHVMGTILDGLPLGRPGPSTAPPSGGGPTSSCQVTIVESPTGTGKTQCLLNTTLSWLSAQLDAAKAKLKGEETGPGEASCVTVGDWRKRANEAAGKIHRSRNQHRKRGRAEDGKPDSEGVKADDPYALDQGKDPAALSAFRSAYSDSSDDDRRLSSTAAKKDKAGAGGGEGAIQSDGDSDEDRPLPIPKLFYTSRTHSQLAQSMEEAERTAFLRTRSDIVMCHVASRSQLCINAAVKAKAGGSSERLNELCIESLAQPCSSPNGCPYAEKSKVKLVKDHMRVKARSLKDLKRIGEQEKGCPYLATREYLPESNLIFLPYGYLVDTSMRAQLCGPLPNNALGTTNSTASLFHGVGGAPVVTNLLEGAVVVIDEAHNLADTAAASLSAECSTAQLEYILAAVTQYHEKYSGRLLLKNKQKLRELKEVLKKLLDFDPLKYAHREGKVVVRQPKTNSMGTTSGSTRVATAAATDAVSIDLSLHDLSFGAEMDQYNFFDFVQFVEDTELNRKLKGFLKSQAKSAVEEKSNAFSGSETKPARAANDSTLMVSQVVRFLSVFARADVESTRLIAISNPTATDGPPTTTQRQWSYKITALCSGEALKPLLGMTSAIILAGGTLQPFAPLVEDLFPEARTTLPGSSLPRTTLQPSTTTSADDLRRPSVLCRAFGHVVPSSQIRLVSLAKGPRGVPLNFSFANKATLQDQLAEVGAILVNLCRVVPDGLVVFFASYAAEELAHSVFAGNGDLARMEALKKVFRESSDRPSEVLLADYGAHLDKCMRRRSSTSASAADGTAGSSNGGGEVGVALGGAVLFAVMGGKLSEGVNFADHLARCVVVVGLPFANPHDPVLKAKMEYLNERKAAASSTSTHAGEDHSRTATPGQVYYQALCMRSVNQSIGRCIRHINDYATVVLLDERYQQQSISSKLPGWMQPSLLPATNFGEGFRAIGEFFRQRKN
jgi:chromosome transmission fidelity protein 1